MEYIRNYKKEVPTVFLLFWFLVIILDNPGDVFGILGADSTIFKLIKYVILAFIYLLYFKQRKKLPPYYEKLINRILFILSIWMLYYVVIYGIFNAEDKLGIMMFFAKHRFMITGYLITIPVIYFTAITNQQVFINYLSKTIIIVGLLSLITVFTSFEILKVNELSRDFTTTSRYTINTGKIIYFGLPLTISSIMIGFKKDRLLYLAGLFLIILIIIAITRRMMVATIEYLLIISILIGIINKRGILISIQKVINRKVIGLFLLIFVFIFTVKPSYIQSTGAALGTVVKAFTGNIDDPSKTSADERLSFTKKTQMVITIEKNLWLGTGYKHTWFIKQGTQDEIEGADYIFLGAFGQFGLLGLLIFLPFYLFAVSIIVKGLKLLRNHKYNLVVRKKYFYAPLIVFIASSAEIIRSVVEYPNWFTPISASTFGYLHFIYLGLLLGSYIALHRLHKMFQYQKNQNFNAKRY